MSKLKKLNRLNKSKTLNVALALGLVASNLVSVAPAAYAANPATAHIMSVSNKVVATTSTVVNKLDPQDVKATITTTSELTAIKYGKDEIPFTLEGDEVTISGSDLSELPNGSKSLKFDFASGSDKTLKVTITDKEPKISSKSVSFNNRNGRGKDVTVSVYGYGLTLNQITNDGDAVSPEAYEVGTPSSSGMIKVTILKEYLSTLTNDSHELNFEFNGTEVTPKITLKVSYNDETQARVDSVSAESDGAKDTITASFDKAITENDLDNLVLKQKIDDNAVKTIDADFTLADDGLSATAEVDSVVATTDEQTVIYSVSYNSAPAVQANEITVAPIPTDIEKPVITLNGDATMTLKVGDTFTDPGTTVTDDVDKDLVAVVTGTVDTATAGSYTLKYNVTDKAGNAADEVTRTVIVEEVDTEKPVITLIGDATMNLKVGDTFTDPGTTVTDNVDKDLVAVVTGSVDMTKAGTYTLKYNVSDKAGNAADEVTRTVVVAEALPVVSSVSAINATTVKVVLKDAPTATLTIADKAKFNILVDGVKVDPSAIATDVTDVTGKTYNLTIPTMNLKQGSLEVNGVAAVIANSDYGYDFQAPTISSIEVVDNTRIKINFAEKMDSSAATVTNYSLVKVSDSGTELLNGAGALGVLSADKKSAIIKVEDGAASTLVPASYRLKVTGNVYDIQGATANQKVYVGTEVSFTPTSDQLADVTGPSLTLATYNTGSGELEFTFDEAISTSSTDLTKVSINGVALTTADQLSFVSGTKYKITLSASSKAAINALTGALKINLAAGAFKDTAPTPNNNVEQAGFDVQKTTPPVATGATYDETTNKFIIAFDQSVKYNQITLGNISISINGSTRVLSDSTVKSLADASSIEIQLGPNDSAAVEGGAGTATTGTVKMTAGAVQNTTASATPNILTDNIPLTYVQDTGIPTVQSANYNTESNNLSVTFSEELNITNIDLSKITLSDGTTNFNLAGTAPVKDATNKALVVFSLTAAQQDRMENEASVGGGADLDLSKTKLLLATGHGLKDMQNNDMVANDYASAITITVSDFNRPIVVANATVADAKTIFVSFADEKGLAMDSVTANTASNYTVALTSGTGAIAVQSAALQPDGKTVKLVLANAHTFVAGYKVTVANVKDAAGNALGTTNNSATYTSVTAVDTTAPKVTSAAVATVAGADNDTITVYFDDVMDQQKATDLSNYTIEHPVGTVLALNATNAAATYSDNGTTSQVVIKLKGINLQNGTSNLRVTVGAGVQDKAGNPIDRTNAAYYIQTVNTTGDTIAPTFTSIVGSAGASVDTITVNFSESVNKTTAENPANYIFESPSGTAIATTPTSFVYTESDSNNDGTADTFKLDVSFAKGTLSPGGNVVVKNATAADARVKDLAGNLMGTSQTTGTVADGVAPSISTVAATTLAGKDNDTVKIVFSESMAASDLQNKSLFAVNANATAIDLSKLGTLAVSSTNQINDTVTITLNTVNSTDPDYDLKNGTTVNVTVSNVKDASGNVLTTATKSAVVSGDTTAPTMSTAVTSAANQVVLTFSEALDPSSVNAADFTSVGQTINYASVGTAGNENKVTLTFGTPIQSGISVKLSGEVADLAGNKSATGTTPVVVTDGVTLGVVGVVAQNLSITGTNPYTVAVGSVPANPVGNLSIEFNEPIKKATANDITLRVYDGNGQVTNATYTNNQTNIKNLLFSNLGTGASNVLTGNIVTNYANLKTAMDTLAGATVTRVEVDVQDANSNAPLTVSLIIS